MTYSPQDPNGQATSANSAPVVLASDQSAVPVSGTLTAGTAVIGKVTTDQTTHGTTDLVAADITKVAGAAIAQGHGPAASAIRVELPTDSTGIINAVQFGAWTVQPSNNVNTTPWLVTQTPATSGGFMTYHLVSAGSTNATNIKASIGQVFGWYIYNSNAAARKVAFHNIGTTPTAGSSVMFSVVLPPGAAANVFSDTGIAFVSGIGITTTTGLADSDATAVAANDLVINIFYK